MKRHAVLLCALLLSLALTACSSRPRISAHEARQQQPFHETKRYSPAVPSTSAPAPLTTTTIGRWRVGRDYMRFDVSRGGQRLLSAVM